MRTTIAPDDDNYKAAQHLSRVSGERLGKVISKLARRGLERNGPRAHKEAERFPTFEVPAGAPIISASRIERVLHEESLLLTSALPCHFRVGAFPFQAAVWLRAFFTRPRNLCASSRTHPALRCWIAPLGINSRPTPSAAAPARIKFPAVS